MQALYIKLFAVWKGFFRTAQSIPTGRNLPADRQALIFP